MTNTTYNGWKNYQTWNVSLWVANEEPLCRCAVAYAKRRTLAGKTPTWNGFVSACGLSGRTPDGIAWNGTRLDRKALNAFISEFAND